MMYDTDVLVWFLRGNQKAARSVDDAAERSISVITYMELLEGARDGREAKAIRDFLGQLGFRMLPLTENIGHRASIYIEEYGLRAGMCVADALVAATAVENQLVLCTANRKHYRPIGELELKLFRP